MNNAANTLQHLAAQVALGCGSGVRTGVRWFIVLLLAGCRTGPTTDSFVAGGDISAVSVRVDVGTVRVRSVDPSEISGAKAGESAGLDGTAGPGEVSVQRTLSGAVEARRRLVHGVLEIDVSCAAFLPCQADLELLVPQGIPLDIELGDGTVEIEGLSGAVRVDLGSGRLRGWDLQVASLHAQLGWGDADVQLQSAPEVVEINAGGGDLRLSLPAGDYDLDVSALGGEELRGVQHAVGGAQVGLRTASGRVSVTGS